MGVLDGRSIWEYDRALGSAIRHYCEYTMAADAMEKHEGGLFWLTVSAYSCDLIQFNSSQRRM